MLIESWKETYTSELGDPITEQLLESLISSDIGGLVPNSDEKVLIAMDGDTIIGSAVSASRHGALYIWGFYILKKYQRMGLGRSLLAHIVGAYDPRHTVILIVLKSSTSAIKFYNSCGFRKQDECSIELVANVDLPAITLSCPASEIVTEVS